jgi:hypothetical protein
MSESYHKKAAGAQPPRVSPIYDNLAAREGFQVMRSAHAAPERVYPRVRVFVYTSTGARVVPSSTGPSWHPGSPVPRAGEGEPNALRALQRHAEECERVEREQGGQRRRAA